MVNLKSCVTKTSMVFHKVKVQTNVENELGIPETITEDYITFASRGILYKGLESTIVESARLGRFISNTCRKTTISSVLYSIKRNYTREMDAFFEKDGPCEILVVNQQCEPDNELLEKLNKSE